MSYPPSAYDILGLEPSATIAQIMAAYAKAQTANGGRDRVKANQAFKQLQNVAERAKQDVFHLCELRGVDEAKAHLATAPDVLIEEPTFEPVAFGVEFLALLERSLFAIESEIGDCPDDFTVPPFEALTDPPIAFEFPG